MIVSVPRPPSTNVVKALGIPPVPNVSVSAPSRRLITATPVGCWKVTGWKLDAGDTIAIVVPSGGGYGDPLDRDPQRVVSDILDGFATAEQAATDYGVVLYEGMLAVDEVATAERRAVLRAQRT